MKSGSNKKKNTFIYRYQILDFGFQILHLRLNKRNYMSKNLYLAVLFIFLRFSLIAQISENSWRDHLSYNNGRVVAVSDTKVYCATDFSVFYLDKDDQSLNHLTPIEGLTEIGVSYIAYCDELHLLMIVYTSGNIDLVDDQNRVTNMSGLKTADFTSNKLTNHINIVGGMAYLSCDFGLVSVNLERREFADTYILGQNGNFIKVNCSAVYGDYIYALTQKGILRGRTDNQFLTDLKNWEFVPGFDTTHNYNTGCVFNSKLIVNEFYDDGHHSRISVYDGSCRETLWDSLPHVNSLTSRNNWLVRSDNWNIDIFDTNMKCQGQCGDYRIQMGISDGPHDIWVAHSAFGLGRCNSSEMKPYTPSGPNRNKFFNITYNAGEMLLAPGGRDIGTGVNQYIKADICRYDDNHWTAIDRDAFPEIEDCADVSAFITHNNRNHFIASTWDYGLIEYNNGQYKRITYKDTDGAVNVDTFRVSSGCYDSKGNLWLICSHIDKYIVTRAANGNWYSYAYDKAKDLSNITTGKMLRTYKGDLWITTPRETGILVLNTNDTPETDADDELTYFMPKDENGESLNPSISDIVEDNNGLIWVASDEGVYVFDHPESVLQGEKFYGRRPQMVIDGFYQPLLKTEKVTSIVIDGGNRKWFGTADGGIFLISADGTEQYAEYNTNNSPLFSNNVMSMSLDYDKGILYIITDKGLQSADISSSIPKTTFDEIFAFPNPVKPDYKGDVQIRGLMNNTAVRITDLYGNLVYETMSNGGGASWNLHNMDGRPVVSGIYLIQCVTDDGETHEATKIHVVR